jgi:hypothetical protein
MTRSRLIASMTAVLALAFTAAAGAASATREQLPANVTPRPSFSPFADYTGAYSLRAHWAWLQGMSDGSSIAAHGGSTRCDGSTNTVQALGKRDGLGPVFTESRQVTRCNSGGRIVIAVIDDGVNTSLDVFPYEVQGADCSRIDTNGYDGVDSDGLNGAYEYDCASTPGAGTVTPASHPGSTHGTEVASAALGNGSAAGSAQAGFYGTAPGAAVMPLDKGGAGDYERAVGIRWAVDHGADVINLSWSYNGYLDGNGQVVQRTSADYPLISQALAYAVAQGALVTCASGNGSGGVRYPANDPNCIAVGSVVRSNGQWTAAPVYSRGPELDFVAAGENAYVVKHDGTVTTDSGTSFAAPAIAGAAAVLKANGVPASQIIDRLRSSARDLGAAGQDSDYGWGLPDLGAAFGLAMPVENYDDGTGTGGGGTGGTGTGGGGDTGAQTVTCAAASASVRVLARVSVASQLCAGLSPFDVIEAPALGSIDASGLYTAPTAQVGTASALLRSRDGRYVQRVNFTVLAQQLTLAPPAATCGRLIAGKRACTIRQSVPRIAGGGYVTVQLRRQVKVHGKLVWRAAGSFRAAQGRITSVRKSLPKGLWTLRAVAAKTSLHSAAASRWRVLRV